MPQVESLHIYPVKSCAGIDVTTTEILPTGLRFDRQWMVIDTDRKFLTQRELPKMAHISTSLNGNLLCLTAPGMPELQGGRTSGGTRHLAKVWESVCEVVDEGDAAAAWLSTFLGQPVRLVRFAPGAVRHVDPAYARTVDDCVGFADAFPVLVIVQESLDDLNRRMSAPLPMQRFRPSIVISGAEPYADDGWQQIRLPDVTLDLVKPSSRCVITQTDPATLAIGKEPLRTLAGYRKVGSKVLFGWNAIPHSAGSVTIGQSVEILSTRSPLFA